MIGSNHKDVVEVKHEDVAEVKHEDMAEVNHEAVAEATVNHEDVAEDVVGASYKEDDQEVQMILIRKGLSLRIS